MVVRFAKSRLLGGIAASVVFAAGSAQALPTGGTVVASTAPGSASIVTSSPTLTVNQTADRVIINWSTFDIAAGETVTFNQPSNTSIAFNQVIGPAQINGDLIGNGGVFLFANGGVFFGNSAAVNVGSLLVSSVALTPADYPTLLNNNRVLVRPPTNLAPGNPFPEINVAAAAQLHANAGVAVFIAPTINFFGSLTSTKSTTWIVAEGAQIDYTLTPGGIQEAPLGTIIQWVVGRGRVSLDSPGTVVTDGAFILNTPSPVLEIGYSNVINLNGIVRANGVVGGTSDSIQLFTSGPTPAGYNGNINLSPGSGPIIIEGSSGTIEAAQNFRFSVEEIHFGGLTVGGNFSGQSYEDIIFNAPGTVAGTTGFSNGPNLRFGNNGVGDVIFNHDFSSNGSFGFNTSGDIIFAPGVHITSVNSTLGGGPFGGVRGPGALIVGAGAILTSFSDFSFNNRGGPVTIGAGAQLISTHSTLTGGGTTFNVGPNALIQGNLGVGLESSDLMTLAPGSQIISQNNLRPLNNDFPLTYFVSGPGSVYIRAAGMNLGGSIISYASGGSGIGDITIEAPSSTTEITVGGPDLPALNGRLNISDAEFQNLYGGVSIGASTFGGSVGGHITVSDLTINGAQTPYLGLYTFGPSSVTVSGTVESFGATRPDFHIGQFTIIDNPTGLDSSMNLIPQNIFISGALGSEAHPLGSVGLIAQSDILLGTPAFAAAVLQNANFNPQLPHSLPTPANGHLFVASDVLSLSANGRIFQQNTLAAPNFGGLLINVPTASDQLISSPNWTALLGALGTFNFGTNGSPTYPNYSAGPSAISLFGSFKSGQSMISGPAAAQTQFLLGGISPATDYFINNCHFGGGCAFGANVEAIFNDAGIDEPALSEDIDSLFADDTPDETVNANDSDGQDADDGDLTEEDFEDAEILADFIAVAPRDPDEEKERLVQSVTGSGNGDLWTAPTPGTP